MEEIFPIQILFGIGGTHTNLKNHKYIVFTITQGFMYKFLQKEKPRSLGRVSLNKVNFNVKNRIQI